MQKIWFFVEGDSEENMVIHLIRKKFYSCIQLEKDLLEFVNKDISNSPYNISYCENCQNVDKIPHRINELSHLIEQSSSEMIIIICDVENLECFSKRKEKIENIINSEVKDLDIVNAFFNPMIEVGYWECEQIIKRVIELEYKNIFNTFPHEPIELVQDTAHPLFALKKSFKKYDLKYRESKFSEMFFPRVNFDNCNSNVLQRIISPLDSVCTS